MKFLKPLLIFVCLSGTIVAQKSKVNEYTLIDKRALQLPDSLTKTTDQIATWISANFKTENEKARAIFIWIASNIQYDIDNMFALNFYEKKEEKISKPLNTRKGICENYAMLFTDICMKSGVQSFVVEGYTRQNGKTDYIPHAWSAARIDSSWFLFDVTWGSGYVNNGKFFKRINNFYYKTSPAALIKSHMPFDYLWQFLYYPVTSQEFYEGRTQQNKSKTYFNFSDSIRVYEKLDLMQQYTDAARRIEKNGVKNSLIYDRLQHLRIQIEHDRQNRTNNLYNAAVVDYNDGIRMLNDFINYRNKQFTPKKSDAEIQDMLNDAGIRLREAAGKLVSIVNPDENTAKMLQQFRKSIEDALTQLNGQQDWLAQYLSKGKAGRKSMFYKVTWFGIPVN